MPTSQLRPSGLPPHRKGDEARASQPRASQPCASQSLGRGGDRPPSAGVAPVGDPESRRSSGSTTSGISSASFHDPGSPLGESLALPKLTPQRPRSQQPGSPQPIPESTAMEFEETWPAQPSLQLKAVAAVAEDRGDLLTDDSKDNNVVECHDVYKDSGLVQTQFSVWSAITPIQDRMPSMFKCPEVETIDVMPEPGRKQGWCVLCTVAAGSAETLKPVGVKLVVDNNPHVIPRTMKSKAAAFGSVCDIVINVLEDEPEGGDFTSERDKWAKLVIDPAKLQAAPDWQAIIQELTLIRLVAASPLDSVGSS